MRLSKRFIAFNKQILMLEIGALIGTPLAPWITAHFTADPTRISLSAVLGGMATGSVFWLIAKLGDEHQTGTNPVRNVAEHIAFFSPAAFVSGLIFYQPPLFFIARHLIANGCRVYLAAFVAQCAAFSLFLLAINSYRVALRRFVGKHL
jgi:hypothetical protein